MERDLLRAFTVNGPGNEAVKNQHMTSEDPPAYMMVAMNSVSQLKGGAYTVNSVGGRKTVHCESVEKAGNQGRPGDC